MAQDVTTARSEMRMAQDAMAMAVRAEEQVAEQMAAQCTMQSWETWRERRRVAQRAVKAATKRWEAAYTAWAAQVEQQVAA